VALLDPTTDSLTQAFTLDKWQKYGNAQFDQRSYYTTDPLYVDEPNGDMHLQASSPAVDRGEALASFGVDKDGVARPQGAAWDLGAYEYVPTCAASADCSKPPPCRTATGATCNAGTCSYPALPASTSCADPNPCIVQSKCDGAGKCAGGVDQCTGPDAGARGLDATIGAASDASAPGRDAAIAPGGSDASPALVDAGTTPGKSGGCGCAAPGASPGALLLLVFVAWRRYFAKP
jgi:hypothetical protein